MNRLRRTPVAGLALVALVVLTAGACSYVDPPVMTITRRGEGSPFFTLTDEELRTELAGPAAEGIPTTTASERTSITRVTDVLVSKFRAEVWKELLKDVGASVNETDRQIAQQQLQSSGGAAGDDAVEALSSSEAYGRGLAEAEFRSGRRNLDREAREYYDRNPAAFSTPAQLCLHAIGIVAGDPSSQTEPSEADYAAAQQRAAAARGRLGAETFEAVAADVSSLRQPGGDLGCVDESELSTGFDPADVQRLRDAAPGTVIDPIRVQGGFFIFRVDQYRAASTPAFEQVRTQAGDLAARSIGRQLANEGLRAAVQRFDVFVDPRYGRFDAETIQIAGPEGALTPTTGTTSTTVLSPVPPPVEEPAITTTTGATPSTTPGTTPGTAPEPAEVPPAGAGTTATTARP